MMPVQLSSTLLNSAANAIVGGMTKVTKLDDSVRFGGGYTED